jgi:hypothetical protein
MYTAAGSGLDLAPTRAVGFGQWPVTWYRQPKAKQVALAMFFRPVLISGAVVHSFDKAALLIHASTNRQQAGPASRQTHDLSTGGGRRSFEPIVFDTVGILYPV